MKIFLGGSAVLATALLTASFVFYVPSVEALPKSIEQENKKDQKQVQTQQTNSNDNKQDEISKLDKNKTANSNSNNSANDNKSTQSLKDNSVQAESYSATAYALRGRTATGRGVSRGVIAADPRVLPLGSKVRVEAGNWSGEYVVADTGARIKGKKVDIWVPNNGEARQFGRRTVKLTVLTYGKRPAAATKTTTANKSKAVKKTTTKK